MKNTTRKLLALLLTLVMIVPMFAFPNVSAETATQPFAFDFEDDADLANLSGSDSPYLSRVTDAENNGVLMYKGTWRQTFVIAPKNFESSTVWTMSGDIKFATAAAKNYHGFYFEPSYGKTDNIFMLLNDAGSGQYAKYNTDNAMKSNAFTVGAWYSFEMIRNGNTLSLNLWAKGSDKPELPMMTVALTTFANTATVPGIGSTNFNGEESAQLQSELYMDNLTFTHEAGWGGVRDDFNNQNNGAFNASLSSLTCLNDGGTTGVAGDADKYFVLSGGKYRFSRADMISAYYTVSTDIYFDFESLSNSSIGFYFYADGGDWAKNALQIFYQTGGFYIDTQKVSSVTTKTWYHIEIAREGTQFSVKIWEKGTAEPDTATYTKTLDTAAAKVPMLRAAKFTSDAVSVRFDNINFVNTTAEHIKYAGVQSSVETPNDAADTTFAMRFLATVDSAKYADARFNVTATYTENGSTYTKTFLTPQKCVAYSSILEYTEQGIKEWEAGDLGGNYLIALNVTDIPKSVGTVQFHVEIYCKSSGGGAVNDSYVVTATVNADGTIAIA